MIVATGLGVVAGADDELEGAEARVVVAGPGHDAELVQELVLAPAAEKAGLGGGEVQDVPEAAGLVLVGPGSAWRPPRSTRCTR